MAYYPLPLASIEARSAHSDTASPAANAVNGTVKDSDRRRRGRASGGEDAREVVLGQRRGVLAGKAEALGHDRL